MAEARIPVDLFNPGQVFACLGFLEASDALIGDARGGFDWSDEADVRFLLRTAGNENPVAVVLEFLAQAKLSRWGPPGYRDPPPKAKKGKRKSAGIAEAQDDATELIELVAADCFPGPIGDRMTLPIRLAVDNGRCVELGHWADESSRDSFKLYAGNRSAAGIAAAMLCGHLGKKGQILQKGIAQLWASARAELIARPFDLLTPMGGSFNFDPRGAWTAIGAGYSPNDQGHEVCASPVVHLLAAWGLENARPNEYAGRKVRYAAWGIELAPMLARAALTGSIPSIPSKHFRFDLAGTKYNKVITFANLESNQ